MNISTRNFNNSSYCNTYIIYEHVLKFVKKINNGSRYYKKQEYFSNLLGQLVWTIYVQFDCPSFCYDEDEYLYEVYLLT
jgi:hypothetical protein